MTMLENPVICCDGTCGNWATFYEAEHKGWTFQYLPALKRVIVRCGFCKSMGKYGKHCAPISTTLFLINYVDEFVTKLDIIEKLKTFQIFIDGKEIKAEKLWEPIWVIDQNIVEFKQDGKNIEQIFITNEV